jgi:Protein of unknown function (DUF4232)
VAYAFAASGSTSAHSSTVICGVSLSRARDRSPNVSASSCRLRSRMNRAKLAIAALVVAVAVVAPLIVLIVADRRQSDAGLERWERANARANSLVARRAHTSVARVDCGAYGGHPGPTGSCNIIRANGQCENWSYDLRMGRRFVRRLDSSEAPIAPPRPDATLIVCLHSARPAVQAGPASSDTGHAMQCSTANLHLGRGPEVSPGTGQNPFVFAVTNRSAKACWLKGYPSVALLNSRGRPLPFVISHRGDQMVTSNRPHRVWLRPHRPAFFALNKYRCDRGFALSRLVRRVRIGLPAQPRRSRTISLPRWPQIGYCGRGDAGSTVAVSPVVSTLAGAFQEP